MIRDETVLLTNLVTCCSRFTIFPWRSSRPGSSLQKEKKCLELLNCLSSFLLYSLADEKKISIISTVYVFIQLRVQDIYQKKKTIANSPRPLLPSFLACLLYQVHLAVQ